MSIMVEEVRFRGGRNKSLPQYEPLGDDETRFPCIAQGCDQRFGTQATWRGHIVAVHDYRICLLCELAIEPTEGGPEPSLRKHLKFVHDITQPRQVWEALPGPDGSEPDEPVDEAQLRQVAQELAEYREQNPEPESRRVPCTVEGCDWEGSSEHGVQTHRSFRHPACGHCGERFLNQDALDAHRQEVNVVAPPQPKRQSQGLRCSVCGKAGHNIRTCPTWQAQRERMFTPEADTREPMVECRAPGCERTFKSVAGRASHEQSMHGMYRGKTLVETMTERTQEEPSEPEEPEEEAERREARAAYMRRYRGLNEVRPLLSRYADVLLRMLEARRPSDPGFADLCDRVERTLEAMQAGIGASAPTGAE